LGDLRIGIALVPAGRDHKKPAELAPDGSGVFAAGAQSTGGGMPPFSCALAPSTMTGSDTPTRGKGRTEAIGAAAPRREPEARCSNPRNRCSPKI